MRRAWVIFRKGEPTMANWSEALRQSWHVAKTVSIDDLYKKYYKSLVNYVMYNFTKTREDAEEICQDVFIRLLKTLSTNYDATKVMGWLKRLAYQVTIDHTKTNRATPHVEDYTNEDGDTYIEAVADSSATENIDRAELSVKIKDAFKRLSENNRKVATLRFIDGYSYEQIAEILEMPLNTVCVTVSRCKAKLRTYLQSA